MGISDLLLQSFSSVTLLGALMVLLLFYIISSSSFSSQDDTKGPPGPKPLPILRNVLQLDLKRPYNSLLKLSKTYGSVFTIYLGPQKVVVLAGYKTVKEALVNYAEEFGDRDPFQITDETSNGHGKERLFTTLLQHFHFSPPPGVSEDDLNLTPRVGFTLNPSPHKLRAVPCM